MGEITLVLILVVALALLFDLSNGWHDAANAIATVVSARVLSPTHAVMLAATLNVAGAFMSTAVAKMVVGGIVEPSVVNHGAVCAALVGALAWIFSPSPWAFPAVPLMRYSAGWWDPPWRRAGRQRSNFLGGGTLSSSPSIG